MSDDKISDDDDLAGAVIERIKRAEGLRFDADVAARLRVDRRNLHGWKSRGTIPLEHLVAYSRESGVSLDWLVNGRGAQRGGAVAEPAPEYGGSLDVERLSRIIDQVEAGAARAGLDPDNHQKARLYAYLYDQAPDLDIDAELPRLFTLMGLH